MIAAPPPVVVFDCMIYLQATTSPSGPAAACMTLVEDGRITLVTSSAVLDEVRDVLARPKIRQKNPRLTDARVTAFLDRIRKLASVRMDVPAAFAYRRDPKDEPYLNLAIATTAGFLVTRDNDLLDLMTGGNADGDRLRVQAPELVILTPPALLDLLQATATPSPHLTPTG